MADTVKHPTAEEVDKFLACKSHDEKCRHYHANPNLASVFRAAHFPNPDAAPETSAPPSVT